MLRQWWAATIAAVWSAATLLLPLCVLGFVGWITDHGSTSIAAALRLGGDLWVAGNGASLATSSGPITLRPLGVTLVVLALLWRAGRWAGSSAYLPTAAAVARLVAVLAIVYAGLVTAAALASASPGIHPVPWQAFAGAFAMAVVAGGAGVLHGSGRAGPAYRRVPIGLRVMLEAGAGATLVLLSGGALLLATSLILHFGQVQSLTAALDAGPVGGLLLLVICLALAPNAAIYALSYAVGPGFALGIGSSVSLAGASIGPLPALPLLGAVPTGAIAPAYAYAAFVVPLLAGLAAGVLAIVRGRGTSAEVAAVRALAAGPVVGVAVLVLTWAAGGGVGSGRLAALGPNPLAVALIATLEVGVLAAVTAWTGYPRASVSLAAANPVVAATTGSESTSRAEAAKPAKPVPDKPPSTSTALVLVPPVPAPVAESKAPAARASDPEALPLEGSVIAGADDVDGGDTIDGDTGNVDTGSGDKDSDDSDPDEGGHELTIRLAR